MTPARFVVLVCGGRAYANARAISHAFSALHAARAITLIVHGGASGADTLAGHWARQNGVEERVYQADWRAHGKAAGPIRNERMHRDARPDLVLVFPGQAGTAHMERYATRMGTNVAYGEQIATDDVALRNAIAPGGAETQQIRS